MVFDDGTHRVELTKVGPGHSQGDAVAYLPKEKILFTGDLCVNWRSGNNVADPDADIPNWVRILGRLAGWDVTTMIPGHGAPGTTATMRAQAAFLDDMWNQVTAGKRAGKSADELARSIDLSRHGDFAADPQRNAGSIRAMYRKAL
jgi:cyclase